MKVLVGVKVAMGICWKEGGGRGEGVAFFSVSDNMDLEIVPPRDCAPRQ